MRVPSHEEPGRDTEVPWGSADSTVRQLQRAPRVAAVRVPAYSQEAWTTGAAGALAC